MIKYCFFKISSLRNLQRCIRVFLVTLGAWSLYELAYKVIIGGNPVGKSVAEWTEEGAEKSVAGTIMEEKKPTVADRTEKFTR